MKRAICSLQLLLLGGLMPLAAQCTDAQDMRYQGVYEGPMSGGIKGVINLVVSGTRVSGSALGSFGLNKSSAGSDPATFRAPSFTGTLDCATGRSVHRRVYRHDPGQQPSKQPGGPA
jgi:hypothetical protein